MNPDPLPRIDRAAAARRRATRRNNALSFAIRFVVAVLFIASLYGAARLGVSMARRDDAPPAVNRADPLPERTSVAVGSPGNPVYLAEAPEDLRAFFGRYGTPGERASADLAGAAVRRLNSRVEAEVLEKRGDAIRVRITSGPIAGTVYWIHHRQVPDSAEFDPIITPLPE